MKCMAIRTQGTLFIALICPTSQVVKLLKIHNIFFHKLEFTIELICDNTQMSNLNIIFAYFIQVIFIKAKMSSFQFTMNLTSSLSSEKLGVTTTVKQQVQNIETTIEHFKRCVDQQKKLQSQLQIQLKKLDQKTHKDYNEMLNEITQKSAQLTDTFKNENEKQNKQFEYLQMQGNILNEEHQKMNQISIDIGGRTNQMENRVGV